MKRLSIVLAIVCLLLPMLCGCGGGNNNGDSEAAHEETELEPTLVLVSISPVTAETRVGIPLQYTAVATYSDGSTKDITTMSNWVSSDESIATITDSGLTTGLSEGEARISIQLEELSGTSLLTIVAGLPISSTKHLTMTPEKASLTIGENIHLQAMITNPDGTVDNVSSEATWTCSEPAIIRIDPSGVATALTSGDVTITVTWQDLLGFATMTVLQTDSTSLHSVSIRPENPRIRVSRSMQLCAVAEYSNGAHTIVTPQVDWTTSNNRIATITSSGMVKALSKGKTTITASLEGESTSTTLSVEDQPTSVMVTDSMGNDVEIPYPVRRIASFTPAATEAIWALGADDRVVGIDMASKWNKEFLYTTKDRPSIGMVPVMPDYEKIISLRPDIVIAYADPLFNYPHLEDKMASAGIKVLRLDLYKPETFSREVSILGQILGKEDKAQEYIAYAESYAQQIQDRVKHIDSDDKAKVYYEWFTPYVAYGEGTGGYQLINMAGGRDIYSSEGGELLQMPGYVSGEGAYYATMNPEWIVQQNPDVVIKDYMNVDDYMAMGSKPLTVGYTSEPDTNEMKSARDEIMSRPGFNAITAVQNGNVYTTPFTGLLLSPRWSVGLGYLAKWFYPDIFEDLDPTAFHTDWLQKWHGLEYQGIFFYPEYN
ncbi:MAG: ABC transporter substrate-binding protein [Chloroflexota bacterium]|nr:ABC transporter substrate-binding protein [Chloroflexota bacterium]